MDWFLLDRGLRHERANAEKIKNNNRHCLKHKRTKLLPKNTIIKKVHGKKYCIKTTTT